MNIKGMTAKELSNMTLEQFNSLNLAETKAALQKLYKAVDQSIRRAEKAGSIATSAPAYKSIMESGGRIRTGENDLNRAKSELKRAMSYMNSKTRTVKGASAHHKQAANYFGLPESAAPAAVTAISEEVQRILEEFPAELAKGLGQSYTTIEKNIAERLQRGNDPEDIRNALRAQYERVKAGELAEVKNYDESLWSEFTKELDTKL